jgi:hypothetical protein
MFQARAALVPDADRIQGAPRNFRLALAFPPDPTYEERVEAVAKFTTPTGQTAEVLLAGEQAGQPVYDIQVVDAGGDVIAYYSSITGWFGLCSFAQVRLWTRVPVQAFQ